jgi:hypothetical protein
MKTEIGKLLENFEGMISYFDDNFKDLKSQLSNLETNMEEIKLELKSQREDLQAKEAII